MGDLAVAGPVGGLGGNVVRGRESRSGVIEWDREEGAERGEDGAGGEQLLPNGCCVAGVSAFFLCV